MPAVFLHGVPDTHRLWRPVVAALTRQDVILLDLPGFGVPAPRGFSATKEEYVDWLSAELARHEGDVDLVAHDWGGMLAARAIILRPELVRSYAIGGSPLSPDYTWHDFAQALQTPNVGEKVIRSLTGELLAATLVAGGVPADAAQLAGEHVSDEMKQSILQLYRSATQISSEWGNELAKVDKPGLLLWGSEDPYVSTEVGRQMASAMGARLHVFDGCGHWWPAQRPAETAQELEAHWLMAHDA